MWIDIFLGIFTLFLGLVCVGMTYASIRIITHKVPSVPTGKKIAAAMIDLADMTQNQVIYDLGCGFGGLLFMAHKKVPDNHFIGFDVVDPVIWWGRVKNKLLRRNIAFEKADFFEKDITKANIIFCYLWPSIMTRIETEIWPSLKPGTKLISHAFELPNVIPTRTVSVGAHKIYLYVK